MLFYINSEIWDLRCAYITSEQGRIVYGLWEGCDSDSTMFNRNVRGLSQMAGQEYSLLYRIDGADKNNRTACEVGAPKPLYRNLLEENALLPAGNYYMEYVIYDILMRPLRQERVELHWNGERMSIPENAWTGRETPSVADHFFLLRQHRTVRRHIWRCLFRQSSDAFFLIYRQ